jgi:hypothetical protein
MRHSHLLLAALCVGSMSLIACSAAESSVGVPGQSNHAPGSGSTSGNGSASNGGNSGNSGTSGSTGNGATPPASGGSNTGSGGGTTPPSGGNTPPPADASTITSSETWSTGKQISKSVVIAAGATVTIAPGAQITIADSASITVQGTLTASSSTGSQHVALNGTAWAGIVVAPGGTLSLDGVDITNAATAIDTQSGNVGAKLDNGSINAAATPF